MAILTDTEKEMNKDLITHDAYCEALQKSWDIECDEKSCFPEVIYEWIHKKCMELGVPFHYIAYPLITAVSYSVGVSFVQVSKKWREPVIIYSLVSGRSGTNKSGSLAIMQEVVEALYYEDKSKQHIFDSGTMEGLMSTLKNNDGSLLCAVDEFSTFLDAMDKNTNGQSERFRYLSLWSGSCWRKNTKQAGLIEIKNPRFNFTGFNQNFFLINISPGAIPNIITSSYMWSRLCNSEVILLPIKIRVVSWSVSVAGGGRKG